jgi:hypothetical protein
VGNTLRTQPSIAKNPYAMGPDSSSQYTFVIEGDRLHLTWTGNSAGPLANPMTISLMRLH